MKFTYDTTMSLSLKDTIQKLQAYTDSSAPILSVYLDLSQHDLQKQFETLVHKALPDREMMSLDKNITYIEGFLTEYEQDDKAQGLAIFSGGDNLFEVISTQLTFEPQLAASHSPYLAPLLRQLDEYSRYLVILADRENAKFIIIRDHTLESESQLIHDEVPQKIKGRNFEERQDIIERHIQDHLHRHFEHVMDELTTFLGTSPVAGVIIGSHDEVKKYIYEHLPQHLRNNILGEIHSEPDAPLNDVEKKSLHLIEQHEARSHTSPPTYLTQ